MSAAEGCTSWSRDYQHRASFTFSDETILRVTQQPYESVALLKRRVRHTILADAMLSSESSSLSCMMARSSSRLGPSFVKGWKVHSFMESARILACSCARLCAVSSCRAVLHLTHVMLHP